MDVVAEPSLPMDLSSAMQGVESSTQDTVDDQMSGALLNPFEKGFQNPLFDPQYVSIASNLEDLNAGMIDIIYSSTPNLPSTIIQDELKSYDFIKKAENHPSTPNILSTSNHGEAGSHDIVMDGENQPDTPNLSSTINHSEVESHDTIMEGENHLSTPNLSSAINHNGAEVDDIVMDLVGSFPTEQQLTRSSFLPTFPTQIHNSSDSSLMDIVTIDNMGQQQQQHQGSTTYSFMNDMNEIDNSPRVEQPQPIPENFEFDDDLMSVVACIQLQKARDENKASIYDEGINSSEQSKSYFSEAVRLNPVKSIKSQATVSTTKTPTRSKSQQLSPQSTGISKLPRNKQSQRKNVVFFESPKTGRPVNDTKKYILGESMDFPASSSPCGEIIIDSAGSSPLTYDSPTTTEQAESRSLEFQNLGFGTTNCLYRPIMDPTAQRQKELETGRPFSRNPEPAGRSQNATHDHQGVVLADLVNSRNIVRVTRDLEQAPSFDISTKVSPEKVNLINLNSDRLLQTSSDKLNVASQGPVRSWTPDGSSPPTATTLFEHPRENASEPHIHMPQFDQIGLFRKGDGLAEGEIFQPAQGDTLSSNLPSTPFLANENNSHSTDEVIAPTIFDEAVPQAVKDNAPAIDENNNPSIEEGTTQISVDEATFQTVKVNAPATELVFEPAETNVIIPDTSTPESKQIASSTSLAEISEAFTELQVSGRRHSVRRLTKKQKDAKARAEQAIAEAAEKVRKAKEEAEERALKEKEREEERRKKGVRRIPREKVIQPLTAAWESRVKAAMDTADMQKVLVKLPSGTNLTRKDLGTVKVVRGRDPAHGWLNDEILLASLQQVVEYGLRISGHQADQTPTYHVFNTFFYKNLRDKGAQSIKRWATKAKIGGKALEQVERVFIPVHQGAHWTLLVVSPMARTIEYFDSMGGRADSYIRNAKLWLEQEMGKAWREEEWSVPTGTQGAGPRQTNGSDCGVFTCTTARMVVLGVDPMAYGGEDMGTQRGRMVAELLNGGLRGDFEPLVVF